jgi:hypothetical protein
MPQPVSPDEGDLEVGRESGDPAFELDPWTLTFHDKALEAEFLQSHMTLMRTAPRVYAIPMFTMFSAAMVIVLTILYQRDGREMPTAMLFGCVLSPGSFGGLLTERKFGGRYFPLFLKAVQLTEASFLVAAAWNPFYQHTVGACLSSNQLANCAVMNQGSAPYTALLLIAVSPMILSVVFGMHFLPVVFIFLVTNTVGVYYILAYQMVEMDSAMVTFILATAVSISVSWVVTRQERETFVWRKVALSETRVELERTVICRAMCILLCWCLTACFLHRSSMHFYATRLETRSR